MMIGAGERTVSISGPGMKVLDSLRETVSRARHSTLYAERLRDFDVTDLDAFGRIALTTRADLQRAGLTGTRAVPIERICHYGETSGTSSGGAGGANSTWLTSEDLQRNARQIAARHPDVFAPGKIVLNRFPFMAAPAHLIQLVAQQGGGVAIPAGNINWDVPFPRALELAQRTGANVLAGFPIEPIILAQIARARGLDPAKSTSFEAFFLGGSPLPPVLQKRIERIFGGARVIELYGSTETMLLGTGCRERTLHLETGLAYCEFLRLDGSEEAAVGEEARLVVTTLGIEGSPLVRFETGDIVRRLAPCACGDARPGVIVLGRESEVIQLAGQSLYPYEIIEAGAAAADALDSSIFFAIAMPDRLVFRIEVPDPRATSSAAALSALRSYLGELPVEVECTLPDSVLDVDQIGRSPSVYKPVLVSNWTRPGRQLISISQGLIEWPSIGRRDLFKMLSRGVRSALRRRQLRRDLRVAKPPTR
jgi:phenylacetate-CoA ligase